MINDNLLWTADEYEAVVDYKANGYNRIPGTKAKY